MIEFFKSLFASSRLAVLLLVSTLIITVLSLITAFYVITVLNKYMASGVTATLIALTLGTVTVIGLEFAFRQNRSTICALWLSESTRELFTKFASAIKGKNLSSEQFQRLSSGAKLIDSVNKNIATTYVLDWPFQLLFLIVLFLVSWTACLIAIVFAGIIYLLEHYQSVTQFRDSTNQNLEIALLSLLTVVVISVGAYEVMTGYMPIGHLIGSNILAARFVQSAQKFFKARKLMEKRYEAIRELDSWIATSTTP